MSPEICKKFIENYASESSKHLKRFYNISEFSRRFQKMFIKFQKASVKFYNVQKCSKGSSIWHSTDFDVNIVEFSIYLAEI
jgi:hypothetical protein